jgi:hypothetical protein
MLATYFASPSEFRAWLERNPDSASELLAGFYKRASGRAGISYPEALDEALAFGWVDGIRRGVTRSGRASHRLLAPRRADRSASAVGCCGRQKKGADPQARALRHRRLRPDHEFLRRLRAQ